jgi:ABC-type transport system involved in multi-copper enzyme maturation permease subunit
MKRLIGYELYRLLNNRFLLLSLPAAAAAYTAAVLYKIPESAGNLIRLAMILANPVPAMWISAALAPLFLGGGFQDRTLNAAVYCGYGRARIVLSKFLSLYSVLALVTIVSVPAAFYMGLQGSGPTPGAAAVLGRTGLCVLLNLGTAGFPMVITFCFRDTIKSVGFACIFTYAMQRLTGRSAGKGIRLMLLRFYPPHIQADGGLWLDMPQQLILHALFISIGCIIAAFLLSYISLRTRDLR